MHVPRARDSCTSYATENIDYLTAGTLASVILLASLTKRVNIAMLIDPRYEWSIFSGPRIQTLPSQLLISSKKDAAVSRGRIHVTNFKILEHQNIIHVPFC
jgi:hypothetical protein